MKLKPEKLLENGSVSANLTRTETSPKREKCPQLPLEISLTMLRKKKRKFSWLSWADDGCIYLKILPKEDAWLLVMTCNRPYYIPHLWLVSQIT